MRLALSRLGTLLLILITLCSGASSQEKDAEPELFIKVSHLDAGLPNFERIASQSLSTPERTLRYFVRAARKGDFLAASYALDLGALDDAEQQSQGPELARKLYRVMERQTGFKFQDVPDRADGEDPIITTADAELGGTPRKALLLSTIPLEIGDFEIYLNHYRIPMVDDVWLFAPTTVDLVPEAYDFAGPRDWERKLPSWLEDHTPDGSPIWAWLLLGMIVTVSGGLALLGKWLLDRVFHRDLFDKLYKGVTIATATWVPYFALQSWAPLPTLVLYALLLIGFCSLVWCISAMLDYYSTQIVRREIDSVKDLDQEENRGEKQKLTYLSVGRRLLSFLVIAIGIGVVALKSPEFRAMGVSLLASAGLVSVILGIAAQPLLGNIISGAQLAMSHPIRVGDAILFEDDWCYVEEITFMSVICRTWDERRLIVPLSSFITQTYSSYSLKNPHTVRAIEIELDYNVDIDGVREELKRIADTSDLWTENYEPKVELTEFSAGGVKLRAMAMADNAADAWELSCQVREALLRYLQTEQKDALPKLKVETSLEPSTSPEGGEAGDERTGADAIQS